MDTSFSLSQNKFLASIIKRTVADRDGDLKVSQEEEALFTYMKEGSDLVELMNTDKNPDVNWASVNNKLYEIENINLDNASVSAAIM